MKCYVAVKKNEETTLSLSSMYPTVGGGGMQFCILVADFYLL